LLTNQSSNELQITNKIHFIKIGEIHIRITIGASKTMWLCGGGHKESLKHAFTYIDENVDLSNLPNNSEKIGYDGVNYGNSSFKYIPSANRKLWTNKKYVGSECKALHGLPSGTHVLSISPNITHDKNTVKISHVILWP
jgi:hypothetical protein